MGEVKYVSEVSVVRKRGPMREARLPGRDDPVSFGVHSDVAEHYGVSPDDYPPQTTTLDYLVASAAG
jgi:hypothetical protein